MSAATEYRDFRLVEKHEAWTLSGPVATRLPDPEIELLESRSMATVAEPGTMALFGFATGTWMAGAVFGDFISPEAEIPLAIVLIFFAGIAQFIGGLFAYRRANALTSNAYCCYGAYNTVIGVLLLLAASGFMPAAGSTATIVGWFNISFGFISLALLVAALRKSIVASGIFFGLTCGYTLIGISMFYPAAAGGAAGAGAAAGAHQMLASSAGAVATAGGALLFLAAVCAFYMAMALVVNSTWKRNWLPLLGDA
ncbi:MAG: GPR1/FUN34/YaaH family transporter [Acetobacteraceae bacterium]